MNKINIAFMGTPEFAVPTLETLYNNENYNIKAVYTQPDKPVGRKMVLTPPPVKVFAESKNIPVFQPDKIRKNQAVLENLSSLNLDFIVVVAYGKILPQSLLDIPKLGCINIHGSLLEKYRGAAPIQWAIANGEKVTGVTTMLMDSGMDTGDMLLKGEIEITLTDTTESLSKKLSKLGSELIINTLTGLLDKTIAPIKQNNDLATYAPMISKNDGIVNWNESATKIYNYSRAFTPWPIIYTFFQEKMLKILSCSVSSEEIEGNFKAGQIAEIKKDGIIVYTGDGFLCLNKIQLSGSKEMSAEDFVRGHRIEPGFSFSDTLNC